MLYLHSAVQSASTPCTQVQSTIRLCPPNLQVDASGKPLSGSPTQQKAAADSTFQSGTLAQTKPYDKEVCSALFETGAVDIALISLQVSDLASSFSSCCPICGPPVCSVLSNITKLFQAPALVVAHLFVTCCSTSLDYSRPGRFTNNADVWHMS